MNEQDEIRRNKYQNIAFGALIAILVVSVVVTFFIS